MTSAAKRGSVNMLFQYDDMATSLVTWQSLLIFIV